MKIKDQIKPTGEFAKIKQLSEAARMSRTPKLKVEHISTLLNQDWRKEGICPSWISENNLSKKGKRLYLRHLLKNIDLEERQYLVFPYKKENWYNPNVLQEPIIISGLWTVGEVPDPYILLSDLDDSDGRRLGLKKIALVLPYEGSVENAIGTIAPFFLTDSKMKKIYLQGFEETSLDMKSLNIDRKPLSLEDARTKLSADFLDQLQFCSGGRLSEDNCLEENLSRLLLIQVVNHILLEGRRELGWFEGNPLRPEHKLGLVDRILYLVRRFARLSG